MDTVLVISTRKRFFISGAIPGELVECEIVSYTKKFKQVKVIQILEPSKDRIPIDCDIF